jgi:hypothetical protein
MNHQGYDIPFEDSQGAFSRSIIFLNYDVLYIPGLFSKYMWVGWLASSGGATVTAGHVLGIPG